MNEEVNAFAQVMMIIICSLTALTALGLATRAVWTRTSRRMREAIAPRDDERMLRLESAVDAIAIEVERISESQRYMVNLLSESTAIRRAELMAPEKSGRSITPH